MSHLMDAPIALEHRGHQVFLKLEWQRPNDEVPIAVRIVQPSEITGLGEVAAELSGPWSDYQAAIDEAKAAAERWISSQMTTREVRLGLNGQVMPIRNSKA